MAEGSDPLLGDVVDGRYRIVEQLGSGGIGTVYRAERQGLGRSVALKFVQPELAKRRDFLRRFEREAVAMSRLYHVHCVSITDFGQHRGLPYLVVEYVPGRPLSEVLRAGALEPQRAVWIMLQVLEALRYFHRRNIVHRDLKPQNLMLVESSAGADFVKVLDFGMAKLVGLDTPDGLTLPGHVPGTPAVMAPEQIAQAALDGRADLYAAGVVLYEMLAGYKPFRHSDAGRLMQMHLTEQPKLPRRLADGRTISAELGAVVLRALEKDRDMRFQTAEEMSKALAATPEAGSGPAMAAIAGRRGRWRLAIMVCVMLLAAGAAALAWYVT